MAAATAATQEYVQDAFVDGGEVGVVVKLNENDADVHAIMAQTLPKHVIIQSTQNNNSYLHLYEENPVLPNALRFKGDYSFELETRFQVEPATTGNGLVHIRSLLNNKYWANFGTGSNWVGAIAVKPVEDETDKNCTLFQPVFLYSNNNRVLKLRHVNTGLFATFFHGSGDYFALLTLRTAQDNDYAVCTFIDWESVVVFPDLIRIKNEGNKHYLKAYGGEGYMDFLYDADNSSRFEYKVYPSRDGGIRLESCHSDNHYWTDMDDSSWVWLRQVDDLKVHQTNTVFLPTKLDGKRIIFRCLKNNFICKSYSAGNKVSCLATIATYTDDASYMEIEEPVVSRRIDNVRYHLSDARLYNEKTYALISDDTTNRLQVPMTSSLNLKTTVTNTTNWSTSVSFTAGVEMSVTFGIPFIESGELAISAEVNKSTNWGETETESLNVGSVKTITVPAMTRVKGSLLGTRLSYDIPFSYTQHDVLKDGSRRVTEKNDGVFAGTNGFGYRFEVVELPFE